ncbi:rod-binding protein [Thiomicrorhabdus xiamenensis]|uniref:Rod-binding protein n=1 Tax=Thiomicrorhabdus xiamenensis TaxID=2739063 RepID=A0A7D4SJ70_9GAMM|nr:rod-binding protein [Thiomicrorhabdus xiamenensis]QKI89579.1 rod-binding protein [Thiomicrorhabdus xiamenensis]
MEGLELNSLSASQAAAKQAQNVADAKSLNALKSQAQEDPKEALRPVAEQFEALFLQQIMKEARKVSFDDGWLDGGQGGFFKDWHDSQLAQSLSAKGSLGLADTIVEQLAPKIDNVYTPEAYYQMQEQKSEQKAQAAAPTTQNALALRNL